MLDSISLVHTLEDSLSLIGLKSAACKLRAVCEIHQDGHPMPEVDTAAEVVRMVVERLRKGEGEGVEELGSNWMKAAEEGRRGDECSRLYGECEGEDFERKLLRQVNGLTGVN